MGNPWDIITDGGTGDVDDPNITYAAVGRALSAWEGVEAQMALLFSVFIGKHPIESLDEREGTVFSVRAKNLVKAFEAFRVRYCDQHFEGDFEALMGEITKMADRRNNIAHGVVQVTASFHTETEMLMLKTPPHHHYGLTPAWYKDTRFSEITLASGQLAGYLPHPAFMFTSWSMDQYKAHFDSYAQKLNTLYARAWALRQASP